MHMSNKVYDQKWLFYLLVLIQFMNSNTEFTFDLITSNH